MCRAVNCKKCGRPTWKGCGAHVEQVLGHVPAGERCRCGTGGRASASASASAGTGAKEAPTKRRSRFFSR